MHKKFNVYFYSLGTPPLHECVTQHTAGADRVCVADDERITLALRGRTSFRSCPPLVFAPLHTVPTGISFFSSGEMSDLFHHPEHRGWTLPHIHQNICETRQINLVSTSRGQVRFNGSKTDILILSVCLIFEELHS